MRNMVYIANTRFPSEKAQSVHVMYMCQALARTGLELTLLVPRRRDTLAVDPFEYFGVEPMFNLKYLPCLDATRWSWFGRLGFWLQTLTFSWSVWRFVCIHQFDVVYGRDIFSLALWPGKAKRVWEAHSLHRGLWLKVLLARVNSVVTLTKQSAEDLSKYCHFPIHIEPDAVEARIFDHRPTREQARKQLDIVAESFVILYVGKYTTMGESKGVAEAMAAIKQLRKRGVSAMLLAVGGTEGEIKALQMKIEDDTVRLLPHQPPRSLPLYYAAADAVVMPFPDTKHFACYMSPLKLFEYLASGVPIVTSDLPTVREIVSEREVRFCEPGDVDSLVGALKDIKEQPQLAKARARAGLRLVACFTWDERAKRILNFLRKITVNLEKTA